ncbi:hypothetical protein GGI12_006373 [Dipsacomyces acuminosporus]|nr:hypothetical protein GGI12_006373 [Dipsacomyces acuminosporus]
MTSGMATGSTAASAADSAMPGFDVSAFSALPAHVFTTSADPVSSELSVAPVDVADFSLLQQHAPAPQASTDKTTPTKQATGRRRKAASGVSAATAAVASTNNEDDVSFDEQDDDEDDDDDRLRITRNGMPLTPDAPGSGRPGSLRHLTPDERRARRLQRNRLAAKECRQKKKAYIQNLEAQVDDLKEENAQLRKEIEELNVKLTLGGMRTSSVSGTPTLISKPLPLAEQIAGQTSLANELAAGSKRPRVSAESADTKTVEL